MSVCNPGDYLDYKLSKGGCYFTDRSENKTFANLDISVRNIKKVQDITYKERVHGANKDNGSTGESPALLLERNEDTQI
jgi:hypothetical protein